MDISGIHSNYQGTVKPAETGMKKETTSDVRIEDLCMDIEEIRDFFYATGMMQSIGEDDKKDIWA